jgi:hypothetical protein
VQEETMKFFLYNFAVVLLAGSFSLKGGVISDFGAGDEGWRSVTLAFPDPGAPPGILNTFVPNWLAAGGNPGGFISYPDPNPNVQYWQAPAKFLGNQSAAYLHALEFSLQAAPAVSEFTQADVILTGAGLTLTHQVPTTPADAWSNYSIALSAGAWRVNSPGGAVASAGELQSVLGALTGLYIRGEYYLSNDTQSLDSVHLLTGSTDTPVPEPGSMMMLLSGLALALRRARK